MARKGRLIAAEPIPADNGFVVVELFTSEGCSSCPPADATLAELLKQSAGRPVYALAFHVDYWDSLGWADPFADKLFSERQRQYARVFKLDSIYTPQAILNGSREFVGSNKATLRAGIAESLAEASTATLVVTGTRAPEMMQIDVTSDQLAADSIVNVAVVEDGLTSDVTRGENRGRVLSHEHVVRVFRSCTISRNGKVSLPIPLPAKMKIERASVVVYAQRPADLKVIAAMQFAVPK